MNSLSRLSSAVACIPFVTPAVKANKCELDSHLLAQRVKVLAVVIFAGIALTAVAAATCGLSTLFIFPWLGLFGLIKLDEWLSHRAIDEKAVNEYLDKAKPSASATAWIQQRPRAAELFISKKGDLNKLDEDGCRLIEALINPLYVNDEISLAIFKLFIKEGIDLNLKDRHHFSYIERIFQSANPHYLQHVMEEKKLPKNLTADQKFNFWFYLGHSPITSQEEFKKLGLNYEIKNREGLTPLTKLIQLDPSLKSTQFSRGLPMDAHIVSLIGDSGILKKSVAINGKQLTIRQFLVMHRKTSEPINKLCKQIEEKESKQIPSKAKKS